MPEIIDPETMYVDDLPGIWSPVQWELSPDEREAELNDQATASLLWHIDVPETILRLLLGETAIQRAYEPPKGYDPEQQGEWNPALLTFQFKRPVRLEQIERQPDLLRVVYNVDGLGRWLLEIQSERVVIERF